jgi:ATP-dependent Lon protease
MTGEITLRGRVLPIGGLKEKLLAAARGGIKTVLIPEDNAKDLTEISDAIKGGLEIIPVSRLDEVIARALVRAPTPIVWEEDTKVSVKPESGEEASGGLTAH